MSEVEDFLSQMLPRYIRAVDAMHNGDPAPFVEVWSRRDPVTLLGAAATAGAGWENVTEPQRLVASRFSNGTPLDFELIAADVHGDLATWPTQSVTNTPSPRRPRKAGLPPGDADLPPGERRLEARAPPRRPGTRRQPGNGRTQRRVQSRPDHSSTVAAVTRHRPAGSPSSGNQPRRLHQMVQLLICITVEMTLISETVELAGGLEPPNRLFTRRLGPRRGARTTTTRRVHRERGWE
jgi:hypothetical protein